MNLNEIIKKLEDLFEQYPPELLADDKLFDVVESLHEMNKKNVIKGIMCDFCGNYILMNEYEERRR